MADNEKYSAEEMDDLRLAYRLLEGAGDSEGGLPKKRYLDHDEEIVARKALVRMLRGTKPLRSKIRWLLAALLDPETETPPFSSFDAAPMERRLEFTARHRGGGQTQAFRKLEMAVEFEALWKYEGKSRDDALNEIADRYSVSVRTVESAFAHYKAVLDE
jgi:hypothetical protein